MTDILVFVFAAFVLGWTGGIGTMLVIFAREIDVEVLDIPDTTIVLGLGPGFTPAGMPEMPPDLVLDKPTKELMDFYQVGRKVSPNEDTQ